MIKKKNKRKKHLLSKHEFIFNFMSLIIIIGIGIYFGYRSLYYYSKQNMKLQEEANTLNGLIIQNNPVVQDEMEGLHQDSDGYYFKGNVLNNYVLFQNKMFRIIRVNKDNTVKLISEDIISSFMWGDESNYQTSNVRNWLLKGEEEYSGVYYQTFSNIEKYLVKTSYQQEVLKGEEVNSSKEKFNDYITTLGIKDYILANGKNSYINNGKMFFLLGFNEKKQNLYVEEDGSIQACDSLEGYGIRSVITLNANLAVSSGDGSETLPYKILVDENLYVDGFVKLGDQLWRIFEDKNDILKLSLYGYATMNGEEIYRNYSKTNSLFDLTDKDNIAYFLNTAYFNSLPYHSYLVDNDYYTGEVSDDTGYSYYHIYSSKVTCKVGLLNIFDYKSSSNLENYFYMNTTSLVGSMQYDTYSNGLLEETLVEEEKHIVPVISILKSSIKSGNGLIDNPFSLE